MSNKTISGPSGNILACQFKAANGDCNEKSFEVLRGELSTALEPHITIDPKTGRPSIDSDKAEEIIDKTLGIHNQGGRVEYVNEQITNCNGTPVITPQGKTILGVTCPLPGSPESTIKVAKAVEGPNGKPIELSTSDQFGILLHEKGHAKDNEISFAEKSAEINFYNYQYDEKRRTEYFREAVELKNKLKLKNNDQIQTHNTPDLSKEPDYFYKLETTGREAFNDAYRKKCEQRLSEIAVREKELNEERERTWDKYSTTKDQEAYNNLVNISNEGTKLSIEKSILTKSLSSLPQKPKTSNNGQAIDSINNGNGTYRPNNGGPAINVSSESLSELSKVLKNEAAEFDRIKKSIEKDINESIVWWNDRKRDDFVAYYKQNSAPRIDGIIGELLRTADAIEKKRDLNNNYRSNSL